MRNATICRLFFAIVPPIVIARRIVHEMAGLDAQLLAAERLHLTMLILDDSSDLDPALVAALKGVGDAVRAEPIAVMLDRVVASSRSIALRPAAANDGLTAMHAQLNGLAGAAGVAEQRGYRFGAHLTVGYRDGAPSSRRVAPVGWVADELVLIHSHVGRTRHDVLGRWSLTGGDEAQLSLL